MKKMNILMLVYIGILLLLSVLSNGESYIGEVILILFGIALIIFSLAIAIRGFRKI